MFPLSLSLSLSVSFLLFFFFRLFSKIVSPIYSSQSPSSPDMVHFFLSNSLSLFILSSRTNFLLSIIVSPFYSFSTPSSPDRVLLFSCEGLFPFLSFSLISPNSFSLFTMIVFPFHSSVALSFSGINFSFSSSRALFLHDLIPNYLFFTLFSRIDSHFHFSFFPTNYFLSLPNNSVRIPLLLPLLVLPPLLYLLQLGSHSSHFYAYPSLSSTLFFISFHSFFFFSSLPFHLLSLRSSSSSLFITVGISFILFLCLSIPLFLTHFSLFSFVSPSFLLPSF
ncbi:unnamed protein product [Acanthosepion pharaonis]|uniref:Uncharacterized protein n=1 Tax=Acanthosepion pharaonis TaxID=158019 RepID=A0A812DCB4_ACAPH|nr:unnamed protein product [Sepia pharaonis]